MTVTYSGGNRGTVDHGYEEIRQAALNILSKREPAIYPPEQFTHLEIDVAHILQQRDGSLQAGASGQTPRLSDNDARIFQEVFWDLFRQGVTTLGLNRANDKYPFFRVSSFGERILANQDAYFFHDVSTYAKVITDEVPNIDDVTMVYLKEAMQAFMSGCILSSSVMLGVATEHTFLLLMEKIDGNATHATAFAPVNKERPVLRKVNKFHSIIDKQLNVLPQPIKEDLDTHFAGILSVIRTFRNDSGHPSGKIISREPAYVNLQLFVPYCKKMYQLMDHYKS